jgi:hypothetical protein
MWFSTFAAKVLGVTREVKCMKDSNGDYTHDVILTKVHITMDDEDLEISAWSHTGVFLGRILEEYVSEKVGFAYVEASTWFWRSTPRIRLNFGPESKLKLPEKKAAKAQPKNLDVVPKTLMELGDFEGKAKCKCTY